jgi:hypothetical protein
MCFFRKKYRPNPTPCQEGKTRRLPGVHSDPGEVSSCMRSDACCLAMRSGRSLASSDVASRPPARVPTPPAGGRNAEVLLEPNHSCGSVVVWRHKTRDAVRRSFAARPTMAPRSVRSPDLTRTPSRPTRVWNATASHAARRRRSPPPYSRPLPSALRGSSGEPHGAHRLTQTMKIALATARRCTVSADLEGAAPSFAKTFSLRQSVTDSAFTPRDQPHSRSPTPLVTAPNAFGSLASRILLAK